MTGKLWYLIGADGVERLGPYFADEVRARVRAGEIGPESPIVAQGMDAPLAIREVPELWAVPEGTPAIDAPAAFVSGQRLVPGEGDLGGFWVRALAYLVDSILLLGPVAMLEWLATQLNPGFGGMALYALWAIALNFFYYGIIQPALEGSPGKLIFGLRLVRDDLARISIGQGAIRFFASFASSLVFGLGYLWVAFHPRKQGWHDLMASTLVVKKGFLERARATSQGE